MNQPPFLELLDVISELIYAFLTEVVQFQQMKSAANQILAPSDQSLRATMFITNLSGSL